MATNDKKERNRKDNISFLIYKDNTIPFYKKISPKVYDFFVYGPSFIAVIAFFVIIASLFYTRNVEQFIRSKEPDIIKSLRSENIILTEKSSELSLLNKELTNKLSMGSSESTLSNLYFINPVIGQKDLTSPIKVEIQDIKSEASADKVFFRFNIVNVTADGAKLSGYIHIFVTDGNTYQKYPTSTEELEVFNIKYNDGESFATSRFRPVEAIFKKMDRSTLIFKIMIFNRVGDLIHQQLIKEGVN